MYSTIARVVLDQEQRDRAAAEAQRLRRRHPRDSREQLAGRLIRRSALRCAAASALWTGPAAFFGAAPFGAAVAFQAIELNRLVHAIAAVYGGSASGPGRAAGVAAGVASGVGVELLRQGMVTGLRRAVPRNTAVRAAAGALAGGALGYGAAVAVGRFAQEMLRAGRRLGRLPR